MSEIEKNQFYLFFYSQHLVTAGRPALRFALRVLWFSVLYWVMFVSILKMSLLFLEKVAISTTVLWKVVILTTFWWINHNFHDFFLKKLSSSWLFHEKVFIWGSQVGPSWFQDGPRGAQMRPCTADPRFTAGFSLFFKSRHTTRINK